MHTNDLILYSAITAALLLSLGWVAVQVLSIIQGARLFTALCNKDLPLYLLISGAFPFLTALLSGLTAIIMCCAPPQGLPQPEWRAKFFRGGGANSYHRVLNIRRIPNATWQWDAVKPKKVPLQHHGGGLKIDMCDDDVDDNNLPLSSTTTTPPSPPHLNNIHINHHQPQSLLKTMVLSSHKAAILPQQLPWPDESALPPDLRSSSPPHKLHLQTLPLPAWQSYNHSRWVPPRSTCANMMDTGEFCLGRYATPEDYCEDPQQHNNNYSYNNNSSNNNNHNPYYNNPYNTNKSNNNNNSNDNNDKNDSNDSNKCNINNSNNNNNNNNTSLLSPSSTCGSDSRVGSESGSESNHPLVQQGIQPWHRITPREGKQRWRGLHKLFAYHGLYSAIPSAYYHTTSIWETIAWIVMVLTIVAAVGGLGWLIYGTVLVSKSGLGQCNHQLYRTALAVAVINWSTPVVLLLLVAAVVSTI